MWAHSSAGRASALQAEGRRFDPVILHHNNNFFGGVAQLARAFGSYPKGRGFESLRRYQYRGPLAQLVRADGS